MNSPITQTQAIITKQLADLQILENKVYHLSIEYNVPQKCKHKAEENLKTLLQIDLNMLKQNMKYKKITIKQKFKYQEYIQKK